MGAGFNWLIREELLCEIRFGWQPTVPFCSETLRQTTQPQPGPRTGWRGLQTLAGQRRRLARHKRAMERQPEYNDQMARG